MHARIVHVHPDISSIGLDAETILLNAGRIYFTWGVDSLGEREKEDFSEEYWADDYGEAYADGDEW